MSLAAYMASLKPTDETQINADCFLMSNLSSPTDNDKTLAKFLLQTTFTLSVHSAGFSFEIHPDRGGEGLLYLH